MISLKRIDTPLGRMCVGATDKGVCLFDFQYRRSINPIMERIETYAKDKFKETDHELFGVVEQQVNEYFLGTRKEFDIPLYILGSSFQKSVWHTLLQIPYGETRSYKQLAIELGNEKAVRAIAGANGDNGLAVIVPCHRIIGEDGNLTGYSGGLQRKRWLLDLEMKYSGKAIQAQLF
jgi:AraC family transcriptional regulator of adaptative response/methylated-DNA-[protein]-cysteine methyltransferase